jgi:DUF1680 family protein
VGNEATVNHNEQKISLKMDTKYPWNGRVSLKVSPEKPTRLPIKMRIPNWALGKENPFGLYMSDLKSPVTLKVNAQAIKLAPVNGYVTIDRIWSKGDEVQLELPMQPRLIHANDAVKVLAGQVAIASGPIIYSLEANKNPGLEKLKIAPKTEMKMEYAPAILDGVNVITGVANNQSQQIKFVAIPYFAIGNINPRGAYKVWVDSNQRNEK